MWTDQKRPTKLQQVLGHDTIIKRLKLYIENPQYMPNLLFTGPAGVGKTSSAISLSHEILNNAIEGNFLELNASDARTLEDFRSIIKVYVQTSPINNAPFKILLLDEADDLTRNFQEALRRMMETSQHIRFIIIVNVMGKLIPPILSRCTILRFYPLERHLVEAKIQQVCKEEDISVTPDAYELLYNNTKGDLRKLINILQSASILTKNISIQTIQELLGLVSLAEITALLTPLFNNEPEGLIKAHQELKVLLYVQGYSFIKILDKISEEIQNTSSLSIDQKIPVNVAIGEVDYRLTEGTDAELQLLGILAKIKQVKIESL